MGHERYAASNGHVLVLSEDECEPTGVSVVNDRKRPPRRGTVIDGGGWPPAREGCKILYEYHRTTHLGGGIWSVRRENCMMCNPPDGPLWQIRLAPVERPGETASGIATPDIAEIDALNRNDASDPRPVRAIVDGVPMAGYSEESVTHGVIAQDAVLGGLSSRVLKEGRMPMVGDTVCLGWMSWRSGMREASYVWPEEVACVIPMGGGNPWCMDGRCLVELVEGAVETESGIIASIDPDTVMRQGVVRATGEGCPPVGTSIIFRVLGRENHEVPSPFGDGRRYSSVYAHSIVAIDLEGHDEDDMTRRFEKARAARATMHAQTYDNACKTSDDSVSRARTLSHASMAAAARNRNVNYSEGRELDTWG